MSLYFNFKRFYFVKKCLGLDLNERDFMRFCLNKYNQCILLQLIVALVEAADTDSKEHNVEDGINIHTRFGSKYGCKDITERCTDDSDVRVAYHCL